MGNQTELFQSYALSGSLSEAKKANKVKYKKNSTSDDIRDSQKEGLGWHSLLGCFVVMGAFVVGVVVVLWDKVRYS